MHRTDFFSYYLAVLLLSHAEGKACARMHRRCRRKSGGYLQGECGKWGGLECAIKHNRGYMDWYGMQEWGI